MAGYFRESSYYSIARVTLQPRPCPACTRTANMDTAVSSDLHHPICEEHARTRARMHTHTHTPTQTHTPHTHTPTHPRLPPHLFYTDRKTERQTDRLRKYNVPECTTNYPKVVAMQAHSTVAQSKPRRLSLCTAKCVLSQRGVGKVSGVLGTCYFHTPP